MLIRKKSGPLIHQALNRPDALNVPSARLTLHSTKLCRKFKIFRKKNLFGTKVTSEAFLSISQNLKVTHLQGCKQTKL
jgi:hypothetical protein